MNIPIVIEIQSDTEWVIKVKNNIYRKCQSGIVWNKFIVIKVTSSSIIFRPGNIDECVFYWGKAFIYCKMMILFWRDHMRNNLGRC